MLGTTSRIGGLVLMSARLDRRDPGLRGATTSDGWSAASPMSSEQARRPRHDRCDQDRAPAQGVPHRGARLRLRHACGSASLAVASAPVRRLVATGAVGGAEGCSTRSTDVTVDIDQGEVGRHHRPQRRRQEHAAEGPLAGSRSRRAGGSRSRGRVGSLLEVGTGFHPGADRPGEHLPQRRHPRDDAAPRSSASSTRSSTSPRSSSSSTRR